MEGDKEKKKKKYLWLNKVLKNNVNERILRWSREQFLATV